MANDLRIVAWMSYDDATENDPPNVGDLGGYVEGTGWPEYIDTWSDEAKPYYEIIREHILANQIFRSGDWHQAEGVPVFSDGTIAAMSMRAWGDMMASIYNTQFGASYSYLDFAWESWMRNTANPWESESARAGDDDA